LTLKTRRAAAIDVSTASPPTANAPFSPEALADNLDDEQARSWKIKSIDADHF